MNDEERTALKAEIVSELGQHLEEHYVKVSDLEALGKLLGELGASRELGERVLDLELTVAITDAHRGIDVTDGQWWTWVAEIRGMYAKRVRKRVAKWFEESGARFGVEGLGEDAQAKIRRLAKLLGGKGI